MRIHIRDDPPLVDHDHPVNVPVQHVFQAVLDNDDRFARLLVDVIDHLDSRLAGGRIQVGQRLIKNKISTSSIITPASAVRCFCPPDSSKGDECQPVFHAHHLRNASTRSCIMAVGRCRFPEQRQCPPPPSAQQTAHPNLAAPYRPPSTARNIECARFNPFDFQAALNLPLYENGIRPFRQ